MIHYLKLATATASCFFASFGMAMLLWRLIGPTGFWGWFSFFVLVLPSSIASGAACFWAAYELIDLELPGDEP